MSKSVNRRNYKRSTSYLPIVVLNNQPSPPVHNYHYQTSSSTDKMLSTQGRNKRHSGSDYGYGGYDRYDRSDSYGSYDSGYGYSSGGGCGYGCGSCHCQQNLLLPLLAAAAAGLAGFLIGREFNNNNGRNFKSDNTVYAAQNILEGIDKFAQNLENYSASEYNNLTTLEVELE